MWILVFYVLSTGQILEYKDTYPTSVACVAGRAAVVKKIKKENPQVSRTEKFDGTGDFLLICQRKKEE